MTMIVENFHVRRQLSELYRDHDVYISRIPGLDFGSLVKITYRKSRFRKKSIYVWLRIIDSYYRTFYNTTTDTRYANPDLLIGDGGKSIVLCRHYRNKLGLSDDLSQPLCLEITKCWSPLKKIRALYNAPDSLTRTTTVISVISLLLGVIALVLGVLSII